jgi:hypothetical protein
VLCCPASFHCIFHGPSVCVGTRWRWSVVRCWSHRYKTSVAEEDGTTTESTWSRDRKRRELKQGPGGHLLPPKRAAALLVAGGCSRELCGVRKSSNSMCYRSQSEFAWQEHAALVNALDTEVADWLMKKCQWLHLSSGLFNNLFISRELV